MQQNIDSPLFEQFTLELEEKLKDHLRQDTELLSKIMEAQSHVFYDDEELEFETDSRPERMLDYVMEWLAGDLPLKYTFIDPENSNIPTPDNYFPVPPHLVERMTAITVDLFHTWCESLGGKEVEDKEYEEALTRLRAAEEDLQQYYITHLLDELRRVTRR